MKKTIDNSIAPINLITPNHLIIALAWANINRSITDGITPINLNPINNIGSKGAIEVAEMLKTNSSITNTTFNLDPNNIGTEGTEELADNTTFNPNRIGGHEAMGLMMPKSSTYLDIDTDVVGVGVWAMAKRPTDSFITTPLSYNNIGTIGPISFAGHEGNSSTNPDIDTDGVKVLADKLKPNSFITTLQLSYNNIGSKGAIEVAEMLKTNSFITTLELSGNNIDANGAIALAVMLKTNRFITILDLSFNNIGTDGAIALAVMLETNRFIINLDLSYNNIDDNGAIALAEGLKGNITLAKLGISGNKIEDAGETTKLIFSFVGRNENIHTNIENVTKAVVCFDQNIDKQQDQSIVLYTWNGIDQTSKWDGIKFMPSNIHLLKAFPVELLKKTYQKHSPDKKDWSDSSIMVACNDNHYLSNMLYHLAVCKNINNESIFSKLPVEIISYIASFVLENDKWFKIIKSPIDDLNISLISESDAAYHDQIETIGDNTEAD